MILAGRSDKLNVNVKGVGNTPDRCVGINTFGLQRLIAFKGFLGLGKHLLDEMLPPKICSSPFMELIPLSTRCYFLENAVFKSQITGKLG